MDPPAARVETFVLKTNIHSRACMKEMKELLEDIKGVNEIIIDRTEIGKITIKGAIDPQKLIMILRKTGTNSELVPNVPIPKSPVRTYHVVIDKEAVEGLKALSKLKGLKTVDLTENGVKLTYNEDENGSCSSTNLHEDAKNKKGEHVTNNDCDFHGNHESCCSRNRGIYMQHCHGCGKNCRYMAPHESIALGIPSSAPEYIIPSAPPVPAGFDADPSSHTQSSDHPSNKFSDKNPTCCGVFLSCLSGCLVM